MNAEQLNSYLFDYFTTNKHPYLAEGIKISKDPKDLRWSTRINGTKIYFTKQVLKNWTRSGKCTVTYNNIGPVLYLVARYEGVKVSSIVNTTKFKDQIDPRQISCYLFRKLLQLSYERIGRILGNRTHATIIHSVKTVENYMDAYPEYRAKVLKYKNELCSILQTSTPIN